MDKVQVLEKFTSLPLSGIQYYESTGSTNDDALNWIRNGAADTCLVIADNQTNGRGRLGRRWVTQPGASLAFSLILHPTQAEQATTGLFSPLGALGICQALETEFGLSPQIKWPNDVLLDRKKTAGILVETSWLADQIQGVVIGIGINISPTSVPPPDDLLFPATCIEESVGGKVDRFDLLRACIQATFDWRAQINQPSFRLAWQDRLAFKGEGVAIQAAGKPDAPPLTGVITGLDDDGSLILRSENNETHSITAGDVHLRPVD